MLASNLVDNRIDFEPNNHDFQLYKHRQTKTSYAAQSPCITHVQINSDCSCQYVPFQKQNEAVKNIVRLRENQNIHMYFDIGGRLDICKSAIESERPILKHAIEISTQKRCILKSINKSKVNVSSSKNLLWRELCEHLLNLAPNQNVMEIYQIYEDDAKYYMALEKLEGGELFEFLLSEKAVPEEVCKHIMRQTLIAVAHLHNNNLIHRDIKPENLMFRHKKNKHSGTGRFFSKHFHNSIKSHDIALIDFDTCLMTNSGKQYGDEMRRRLVGTYGYLAPEVLRSFSYSKSSDLWAVGVILYILMTGVPPVSMENMHSVKGSLRALEKTETEGIDFDLSPLPQFRDARDLCQRLLNFDSSRRIQSADDALNHPWLHEADNTTAHKYSHSQPIKNSEVLQKPLHVGYHLYEPNTVSNDNVSVYMNKFEEQYRVKQNEVVKPATPKHFIMTNDEYNRDIYDNVYNQRQGREYRRCVDGIDPQDTNATQGTSENVHDFSDDYGKQYYRNGMYDSDRASRKSHLRLPQAFLKKDRFNEFTLKEHNRNGYKSYNSNNGERYFNAMTNDYVYSTNTVAKIMDPMTPSTATPGSRPNISDVMNGYRNYSALQNKKNGFFKREIDDSHMFLDIDENHNPNINEDRIASPHVSDHFASAESTPIGQSWQDLNSTYIKQKQSDNTYYDCINAHTETSDTHNNRGVVKQSYDIKQGITKRYGAAKDSMRTYLYPSEQTRSTFSDAPLDDKYSFAETGDSFATTDINLNQMRHDTCSEFHNSPKKNNQFDKYSPTFSYTKHTDTYMGDILRNRNTLMNVCEYRKKKSESYTKMWLRSQNKNSCDSGVTTYKHMPFSDNDIVVNIKKNDRNSIIRNCDKGKVCKYSDQTPSYGVNPKNQKTKTKKSNIETINHKIQNINTLNDNMNNVNCTTDTNNHGNVIEKINKTVLNKLNEHLSDQIDKTQSETIVKDEDTKEVTPRRSNMSRGKSRNVLSRLWNRNYSSLIRSDYMKESTREMDDQNKDINDDDGACITVYDNDGNMNDEIESVTNPEKTEGRNQEREGEIHIALRDGIQMIEEHEGIKTETHDIPCIRGIRSAENNSQMQKSKLRSSSTSPVTHLNEGKLTKRPSRLTTLRNFQCHLFTKLM